MLRQDLARGAKGKSGAILDQHHTSGCRAPIIRIRGERASLSRWINSGTFWKFGEEDKDTWEDGDHIAIKPKALAQRL